MIKIRHNKSPSTLPWGTPQTAQFESWRNIDQF